MFNLLFDTESIVIEYNIEEVGDDLEISITGGDVHIGAIGLVSNSNYDILSVDNHKESEIIVPLAKRLGKYDDMTILIKAGIHVDDISSDEICQILKINENAIEKIDKYISSEYE